MQIPTPQDDALLLTDITTKTASFDTVVVAGGPGDMGNGFAPGGVGMPAVIVVDVSALDKTTGDETYFLKMQESADNATWTDCGAAQAITAVGVQTCKGFLTKQYIRLDGVLAGTTPIITLKAWLNTSLQR